MKRVYEIDANNFSTLEGFYDEFGAKVLDNAGWGKNLDAFDDVLYGGFNTPEDGFILVWNGSEKSKLDLGYSETARQLALRLKKCHPTNRESVREKLEAAKRNEGATVFEWVVEIIKDHNDIELILT